MIISAMMKHLPWMEMCWRSDSRIRVAREPPGEAGRASVANTFQIRKDLFCEDMA
jgi:hypothetical protein